MKDAEAVAKRDAWWSLARARPYCLPAKVIKREEKDIHGRAGVRNNGPLVALKTLFDLCRRPELAKLAKNPCSQRGGWIAVIATLGCGHGFVFCFFFLPFLKTNK